MLGSKARTFFGISIGFLLIAVILAAWGFNKIVSKQIQRSIQIENSSMMFEKWRKLPMPLTFKIYVFNVTNPDAISEGEYPVLQEIGPYVYKQYREKTILGYGDNDTVEYMLKKTFVFDETASGGLTEDDLLTVIHFPYMAALLTVHSMMPSFVGPINNALKFFFPDLTDAFLRVSARDLFFDGIYLNCSGDNAMLGMVCTQIKAQPQPTMRPAEDGTGYYFSMFSHLNRTASGPYAMSRGRENVYDLGHIVSYKGQTIMKQWEDPYCGQINGSDSSIFPPIDESHVPERIYSFEPDVCRSMYVSLVGKRSLFNFNTYYYEISEMALAAKTANKENKCFCKTNWSANHDGCLMMGLLNLMPCQGAPAIVSLPHFYLGSEELLEFFEGGIEPVEEKHKSFVYIDPITGVVLKGLKRLQFNIELRNMKGVPSLEQVKTGLFPLLWIEEGAEIPEEIQDELRHSHALLQYVEIARWGILAVAILATVVSAIIVSRATALPIWPKNRNSVSFILSPNNNK